MHEIPEQDFMDGALVGAGPLHPLFSTKDGLLSHSTLSLNIMGGRVCHTQPVHMNCCKGWLLPCGSCHASGRKNFHVVGQGWSHTCSPAFNSCPAPARCAPLTTAL